MKHLLSIEGLDVSEINQILIRALEFEKGKRSANHPHAHIVNMFFENSTRTKMSFEMAANKIHAQKYDFCAGNSSINKGEDIYDTVNNLSAIGANIIVMRHENNILVSKLSKMQYFGDISFVNAGSGTATHPTQALLDYYTMKQRFVDMVGRIVVFVGDVAHSRVAKSNIALLKKFGAKIRCLCPEYFKGNEIQGVEYFSDIKLAFKDADVVMALRIQRERIEEKVDLRDYIEKYQINSSNLPQNAFLLHPGPVNKGIEISSELFNTNCTNTFLKQAHNGVFIRMAVLDMLLGQWGL